MCYRTLGLSLNLHPIDGEVVVVDRRPPPHQLDAHRGRAAVEVVGLDLPRPAPAADRDDVNEANVEINNKPGRRVTIVGGRRTIPNTALSLFKVA